jgi:hypothetical protein
MLAAGRDITIIQNIIRPSESNPHAVAMPMQPQPESFEYKGMILGRNIGKVLDEQYASFQPFSPLAVLLT